MKKSFLTALFALSIATSMPIAKVESMDLRFIKNFKEATKELITNTNVLSPFMVATMLSLSYGFINRVINVYQRNFRLAIIKHLLFEIPDHINNKYSLKESKKGLKSGLI